MATQVERVKAAMEEMRIPLDRALSHQEVHLLRARTGIGGTVILGRIADVRRQAGINPRHSTKADDAVNAIIRKHESGELDLSRTIPIRDYPRLAAEMGISVSLWRVRMTEARRKLGFIGTLDGRMSEERRVAIDRLKAIHRSGERDLRYEYPSDSWGIELPNVFNLVQVARRELGIKALHCPPPGVRYRQGPRKDRLGECPEVDFRLLTERERKVAEMRWGLNGYGKPCSLGEIAEACDMSREGVRHILRNLPGRAERRRVKAEQHPPARRPPPELKKGPEAVAILAQCEEIRMRLGLSEWEVSLAIGKGSSAYEGWKRSISGRGTGNLMIARKYLAALQRLAGAREE